MKKPVKGVIALGAAALLSLGGLGTYALWSDSVVLSGGTLNSGRLEFTGTTTGSWADVSSGTPVPIADISTFLLVPGDVLTYTLATTIQAEGDNLAATLAADPSSVTGDAALLADVSVTTAVTVSGTPITAVTDANDGQQVDVVVTFDFTETSLNATQLQSLDLSGLQLTLTQNPR